MNSVQERVQDINDSSNEHSVEEKVQDINDSSNSKLHDHDGGRSCLVF